MGMTSQTLPMLSYINFRKPYKLFCYLAGLLALIVSTIRVVYVLMIGRLCWHIDLNEVVSDMCDRFRSGLDAAYDRLDLGKSHQ